MLQGNTQIITAYNQFLRDLIITFSTLPKEEEIEILINSYSKEELAQICLICLEIIREKNKLIGGIK